jgi:2,4-diketo-3-deoxy-L-fuconate hydrolase
MPGLVMEERTFDLGRHLGLSTSVRTLLDGWDRNLSRLQELAEGLADEEGDHRLGTPPPRLPLFPPGQLFLSRADYRQHVIELTLAERQETSSQSKDELRAQITAGGEQRVGSGRHYVFLGSRALSALPTTTWCCPTMGNSTTGNSSSLSSSTGDPDVCSEGRRLGASLATQSATTSLPAIGSFALTCRGSGRTGCTPRTHPPSIPPAHSWPRLGSSQIPWTSELCCSSTASSCKTPPPGDASFGIDRLIGPTSAIAQLQPGDLLLTGSPAGNGVQRGCFSRLGDVMEGEVTGLGVQCNRCVTESWQAQVDGAGTSGRDRARPKHTGPSG